MEIRENLKYTKDHEWILVEGDQATVGITDFAQSELGDLVFIDISTEGESLSHGEVFGSVEAVKTVSDLYMPVSGEVLEVNSNLDSAPETVNSDPYGDGWMVKIKLSDLSEINDLLSADDYKSLVGE